MRRFAQLAIALVLLFAVATERSPAATNEPHVVVDIIGFAGPNCSAALIEISNRGNADQPFGWTLTLNVKKLGISETYVGQQPLAAGSSFVSGIGTEISRPGNYVVKVTPGGLAGKGKSGHAVLRLPATC